MTVDLLEPDFVRRLARLKLLARRRFAGSAGSRRSHRRGASAEFADHRPYYAGDDIRRIDWNAYARLEELVLRLFVAEEDLTLYILLDTSESLAFGTPAKIDQAKQIAAALSYVALTGSERVSVVPFGSSVKKPLPPARGKGRVGSVLRFLSEQSTEGGTDLSRTVDEFLARSPRPGLVAVISDLLDPGGYQRPIDRLISARHEPAIFHVLSKEETDPEPGGDFVLVDSERGNRVDVSLDSRVLRAYRARVRAFLEGAETYARKRGCSYVRLDGVVPFEDALLQYLRAAS